MKINLYVKQSGDTIYLTFVVIKFALRFWESKRV